jgi:serine/threonine-protein kinase
MSANPAANNLFLQAEYQASRSELNYNYDVADWKAAIPLYRQAIAEAPDFALAYARLSWAEDSLAWFGGGGLDPKPLFAHARADAQQALRLAPHLPASLLAMGYSDYYSRSDYAGALKAFTAALELHPNDADALAAQGYVERRQGRYDEAAASLKKAFALDPRNSSLAFELGGTYQMPSRWPEAETWYRRALALDPDNRNAKTQLSYTILYATGDVPQALATAQGDDPALELVRSNLLRLQRKYAEALAVLRRVPDTPDNFQPGNGIPKALQAAELYRLKGDQAKARTLCESSLPRIRGQVARQQGIAQAFVWTNLARAELGLGDTAQALATVAKSRAIVERSHDHGYGPILMQWNAALYAEANRPDLAVPLLAKALVQPGIGNGYSRTMLWLDPVWDPIRHDPGFRALLKKYAKSKPAVIPPHLPLPTALPKANLDPG